MTIETKFNIGDKAWSIVGERIPRKTSYMCPVCNGTGKMKIFGNKKCDASIFNGAYRCKDGYLVAREYEYIAQKGVVSEIFIDVSKNSEQDVEYEIGNSIWDQKELYATEEEAQAECDRRNNKIP